MGVGASRYREAYEKVLGEMEALPSGELVPVNVDRACGDVDAIDPSFYVKKKRAKKDPTSVTTPTTPAPVTDPAEPTVKEPG